MLMLDENIRKEDWHELRRLRIRARKIGEDVGRAGMDDSEIIPLLHRLKSVTFFTDDIDYYRRQRCHAAYCLVYLAVPPEDTVGAIRRFLRHPSFRTWAQRKGRIIRVGLDGMRVWRGKRAGTEDIPW
jgi:hypothetical protein